MSKFRENIYRIVCVILSVFLLSSVCVCVFVEVW